MKSGLKWLPGTDQSFGGYRDAEKRLWFKNYIVALRFAKGEWTHFDQICPAFSYLQLAKRSHINTCTRPERGRADAHTG